VQLQLARAVEFLWFAKKTVRQAGPFCKGRHHRPATRLGTWSLAFSTHIDEGSKRLTRHYFVG
jgi:hypothetical protein